VTKGGKATGLFAYINDMDSLCQTKSRAKTAAEFAALDHLELAMSACAAGQLRRVVHAMGSSEAPEKVKQNELFADELVRLTKLHLNYCMFKMALNKIARTEFADAKLPELLRLLAGIYALKELTKDNQMLYETCFFGPGSATLVTSAYNAQLLLLRPHVLPLVEMGERSMLSEESWNISTIGNKYGDIYETQLAVAKASALNNSDGSPPPYYKTLMQPLIHGSHVPITDVNASVPSAKL